jgi:hypothetical protein|eukprot:SAG25_NODE_107_length_15283_cov_3.516728_12_plen_105_part_00
MDDFTRWYGPPHNLDVECTPPLGTWHSMSVAWIDDGSIGWRRFRRSHSYWMPQRCQRFRRGIGCGGLECTRCVAYRELTEASLHFLTFGGAIIPSPSILPGATV